MGHSDQIATPDSRQMEETLLESYAKTRLEESPFHRLFEDHQKLEDAYQSSQIGNKGRANSQTRDSRSPSTIGTSES